jgi:cell division protein FtsL
MEYRTAHTWDRASSRKSKVTVYLLIFAITVLLVIRVGAQTCILSLGREINEIEAERTAIEMESKSLEFQIAELRKGSRIITIARDRLGMVMPQGAPQSLF